MSRIKILFVDENQEQLAGLKKLLTDDNDRWECHFSTSGSEVLDLLAQHTFNVIVTDIVMPILSGNALLSLVREHHPEIIRIIFSDCTDQRTIVRAAQMAHRYIPKPCSASTLRRTIENTLYIHVVLDNESIRKVLIQTTSLPSVPSVYSRLMEQIENPDFSLHDAAELISHDVGLTVNILKQVNQFGFNHSISDIKQAVTLLGLDVIRAIALTTHIFHSIGKLNIPHFSIEKLMKKSMLTALFAKQIMMIENRSRDEIECAFIAGMLHQLGTLVFVVNFSEKYCSVMERVHDAHRPILMVEQNLIGISHPQIGAHLLALWGLPESILNAVAFYREPQILEESKPGVITAVFAAYHLVLEFLEEQDWAETEDITITEQFDYQRSPYILSHNLTERFKIWRDECHILYLGLLHG